MHSVIAHGRKIIILMRLTHKTHRTRVRTKYTHTEQFENES